jgi:tetratricopeptide (TPR) repeat protein
MAKNRLTKKQMQTDELEHALVDARDYVVSHRSQTAKMAGLAAGALLLIAAIWGGITYRSNGLGNRFSQALATLDAPLVTDGAAVAPGQRVYKDAAERLNEGKSQLKALASDAPSSRAGRAAALMLLSLDGSKGVSPDLLKAAEAFARSESGSISAGLAASALLDAQAASGRTKEAIEIAKRYLESADSPLPKDLLVFTLAKLYEKAGQLTEARTFYQRVVSDFPESTMRFEAQQKVSSL